MAKFWQYKNGKVGLDCNQKYLETETICYPDLQLVDLQTQDLDSFHSGGEPPEYESEEDIDGTPSDKAISQDEFVQKFMTGMGLMPQHVWRTPLTLPVGMGPSRDSSPGPATPLLFLTAPEPEPKLPGTSAPADSSSAMVLFQNASVKVLQLQSNSAQIQPDSAEAESSAQIQHEIPTTNLPHSQPRHMYSRYDACFQSELQGVQRDFSAQPQQISDEPPKFDERLEISEAVEMDSGFNPSEHQMEEDVEQPNEWIEWSQDVDCKINCLHGRLLEQEKKDFECMKGLGAEWKKQWEQKLSTCQRDL